MLRSLKNKIVRLLGGYTDDDVLTEVVKDLYNTIGVEDILREEKNQWLYMDKPLSIARCKLLVEQAKELRNSELWQIMTNDVKYQANKMMYLKAESEIQITAGKLWTYTLDCFNQRLENLSQESGQLNKTTGSKNPMLKR